MYNISLGYVTVPTAGTPKPLSTVLSGLALDPELKVHELRFSVIYSNTSRAYVGLAGTTNGGRSPQVGAGDFNKTTGANLLEQLQQTAAGAGWKEEYSISSCDETNAVRVANYAIDVDVNAEGLIVSAKVV